MVVAPRVGTLALVLQNTEDEGFLYARHKPLVVRVGGLCGRPWGRKFRRGFNRPR